MHAFSLKLGVTLVALLGVLGINAALAGPIKITIGTSHALVVKSDGSAWGWGNNNYGQLGSAYLYGTMTPVAPPIKSSISKVVAMAAPCYTTHVLRSNGTVWSYGENIFGVLGNGTLSPPTTYTPTQVLVEATRKPLVNIIAISSFSDHTLALKSDGTVWAWGNGRDGQLGDGTTISHYAAVQVLTARATSTSPAVALSGVVSIFTGNYTSYAIKGDGTVWAWGSNAHFGMGDANTTLTNLLAAKVPGLTNVAAIAPGTRHYVALKKDGTVWTWGRNNVMKYDASGQLVSVLTGQLGDNSPADATRATATMLSSLSGITKISTHWNDTLALKGDGTVWAWGENSDGQLGNRTFTTSTAPVAVYPSTDFTGVVDIATGPRFSAAVTKTGNVFTWGSNSDGELGVSRTTTPYSLEPIKVPGITP